MAIFMPRIDWRDLQEVCAVASRLGPGQTVFKHPDRKNYNITHTARRDLYQPDWVCF